MGKRIGLTLGTGIVLILLYLLFWPVRIDPAAWNPPDMPPLTGVYQVNNRLAGVERLGESAGLGPEDVAFDPQGFLYTGVADGRILRFLPGGNNPDLGGDEQGMRYVLAVAAGL